ncbi:MAG: response regulator [Treponema sp.]|jgi:signal transduction histidine kinase/CheY-like chemotaxis protein/HPt (histidine-containing phosphotransfer) domain-containing protein|nr:response regulator [Treponema sp.]
MDLKRIIKDNYRQLLFVVLAFVLMILVSYIFVSNIMEKQIVVNAREMLANAEYSLTSKLQETEAIINTAAFSLQRLLEQHQGGDAITSYVVEFTWRFGDSSQKTPGFMGIYGYFDGRFYDGTGWIAPENYDPLKRSWYTNAIKTTGNAISVPYVDPRTGALIISISRALYDPQGNVYGVIAIDVDLSNLARDVRNIQFAEGGYGMLLDMDFTYIAHPDSRHIGKKFQEVSPEHARIVRELEAGATEINARRLVNPNGISVITFFRKLSQGWYIGMAAPVRVYYHDVYTMAFVMTLLGLALMVILGYLLIRLSIAKIQSDEENKSKSSFLARMSHEIRTPMNSILGMSELIMRKDIPGDVLEYISVIRQAGVSLLAIINDILDFSKIESGRLYIESKRYDLASMINDVINVIHARVMEKQIDFFVDVDPHIPAFPVGDEVRTRQILINLLNNAVKYTPKGKVAMEIKMERIGVDKLKLILRVSDTGIGIKEEEQKNLFNEFMRLDVNRNQGIEGTGLGLTIANSFCRAMGGGITVSSTYGQGSVFTATIIQGIVEDKKLAAVEHPEQKRVLIHEERPCYLDTLISAFKNLDVIPVTAANLAAFMKDLEEGDFDFAFVSSRHAVESIRVWGKRKAPLDLVIMVDLGEASVYRDTGSIMLPVYSVSLANVLNGIVNTNNSGPAQKNAGIRFSAPDARILIVDDIATNLRVAAELMAPYNMNIDTCQSGAEAVHLAKQNRYDLIFMDHMMPEMDGLEATVLIRNLGDPANDAYYRSLPIVALTANAISGQREMFLKNGIDDFLAKPIEMQKLNNILEKWLPRNKRIEISQSPTGSDKIRPPDIKGINVEAGLVNVGGSGAAYQRILTVFYRDANDRIQQIRDAIDSGNITLYTTLVHALKSASRSIGAVDFGDFAAEMESAGKNQDLTLIHAKTEKLLEDLQTITDNISAALDRNTANAAESTDPSAMHLENLKDALVNMNIEAVNKLISEYMSMPMDVKTKEKINEINQDILLFEYDKAIEKIDLFL